MTRVLYLPVGHAVTAHFPFHDIHGALRTARGPLLQENGFGIEHVGRVEEGLRVPFIAFGHQLFKEFIPVLDGADDQFQRDGIARRIHQLKDPGASAVPDDFRKTVFQQEKRRVERQKTVPPVRGGMTILGDFHIGELPGVLLPSPVQFPVQEEAGGAGIGQGDEMIHLLCRPPPFLHDGKQVRDIDQKTGKPKTLADEMFQIESAASVEERGIEDVAPVEVDDPGYGNARNENPGARNQGKHLLQRRFQNGQIGGEIVLDGSDDRQRDFPDGLSPCVEQRDFRQLHGEGDSHRVEEIRYQIKSGGRPSGAGGVFRQSLPFRHIPLLDQLRDVGCDGSPAEFCQSADVPPGDSGILPDQLQKFQCFVVLTQTFALFNYVLQRHSDCSPLSDSDSPFLFSLYDIPAALSISKPKLIRCFSAFF